MQLGPGRVPQLKRYLDEMPGVPIQDVWTDITPVTYYSKERVPFPTQKPQALLERIIRSSTNRGDLVIDGFCGCGSALATAQSLGRRWVGVDVSHKACMIVKRRISSQNVKAKIVEPSKTTRAGVSRSADMLYHKTPGLWRLQELHRTASSCA